MREFVNLGVYPSEGAFQPILEAAKQLGYTRIGFDSPPESSILDTVYRVDIHPRSQNDLGKQVRKLRHKVEVITVHCHTKPVSRQAARDNRVDLLRFPVTGGKGTRFLDRQQAGLMRDSGVGFEVPVGDLLVNDRDQLVKRIGVIIRDRSVHRHKPQAHEEQASCRQVLRETLVHHSAPSSSFERTCVLLISC